MYVLDIIVVDEYARRVTESFLESPNCLHTLVYENERKIMVKGFKILYNKVDVVGIEMIRT